MRPINIVVELNVMGKTQKRIEARKAAKAAHASIIAHNQSGALQRHARQAAQQHEPLVFGFDPELDSDHDFEAFGTPMHAKRDQDTGEILSDVWPNGFRGIIGVDNHLKLNGYTTNTARRRARRSDGEVHIVADNTPNEELTVQDIFNMKPAAYAKYVEKCEARKAK